jgi:kumamolisin
MSSHFVCPSIKPLCAAALMSVAMLSQAKAPQPLDVGSMSLARGAAPVTVTVALKLRDRQKLEALVQAMHTPGSPQFHRFITPDQFHAQFSPTDAVVAQTLAHFRAFGLTASVQSGSLLKVTGSPDAIDKAFSVQLHLYDVAASGRRAGFRFHAPVGAPQIASAAVAANVESIIGLDDAPHYRPHMRRAANSKVGAASVAPQASGSGTGEGTLINPPGLLTVQDVAQYYNIKPLYDQGYTGAGRTLAIVTLASFTPSDAFTYWNQLSLHTDPKRLKIVDIDGGPGVPDDDAGSGETTLDVQQSGGLAPGAKIIVYQAPNTDQAFVDAFAKAINDNTADSVSVSWGEWEWIDTQDTVGKGRRATDVLSAFNSLFLQGAAQGQTLFAASGDSGAYDDDGDFDPSLSVVLGVDSPAVSPWITAAGGTTLPGKQKYDVGAPKLLVLDIPREAVWGWDYLIPLCNALGLDPVACGIYPAGSGGGVSYFVPMPFYQYWVSGTKKTEPGQQIVDTSTTPPTVELTLPARFAGRNVPDVSLNADPQTGYLLPYTSSATGYGVIEGEGGTSFVAPQLNGIAALLGQRVHGRIGLLNVPLYAIAATPLGYLGNSAPLHDIKDGDNWFYQGRAGYDQGSGVGTLDVANFAKALLLLGY